MGRTVVALPLGAEYCQLVDDVVAVASSTWSSVVTSDRQRDTKSDLIIAMELILITIVRLITATA